MKQFLLATSFLLVTQLTHSTALAQKGSGLDYYVSAENLRKAKRFDAAMQQYSLAVKAEPDVADYWYGMAECWWEMKNPSKALETLNKCSEVKKEYVKAYELAAHILNASKSYSQAGDHYALAFEYHQEPAKQIAAAIGGAAAYNKAKMQDKALTLLEKAKAIQPDNLDLNYIEVKIYNQQKQYQKAIDVLSAFLPQMPANTQQKDYARLYYELGFAYHQLEDYPKSVEALKKADFGAYKQRVYELSPEYFFKVADAYAKVYEYQKANDLLNKAIKIKPNYREANDLLKEINEPSAEIMKRIRAEMDSINKEKNPDKKSKLHCSLCRNQFKVGEYAAAAASAEECLRTNQKNILFIFYKSIAQYKSGNHSMAILEMDKISKTPTLPPDTKAMMYFALGLMYKEDKQPQVAANYFRRMNGTPFAEAAKLELKALRKGDTDEEEEEE
jgi:tetratricopeptide (TPR) repeat protein